MKSIGLSLSPEIVLYLYKSTIHPCMEYCWQYCWIVRQATTMNLQDCWSFTCYFSWTLGSLLKCGHLIYSASITLVGDLQNWLSWFHFLFPWGRSAHYSDTLHDFSVTITRCYKDVYVNGFFPHAARLWNSLPIKCSPLTYNLNGFKSRSKRHLLTLGSF